MVNKNILHTSHCLRYLTFKSSYYVITYSWEKNFIEKRKKNQVFSGNLKKTWLETSSSSQVKFCFNRFKSSQVQVQPDLELQVRSSLNIFKLFGHSTDNHIGWVTLMPLAYFGWICHILSVNMSHDLIMLRISEAYCTVSQFFDLLFATTLDQTRGKFWNE